MTTTTLYRDILESIGNTRDVIDQAHREGCAIRGELGPEAQILALSEQYKRLRAAGRLDEAAAVKAAALAIYQTLQQH